MAFGLSEIVRILHNSIDRFTNHISAISTDHEYIHKGMAFTAICECGSISEAYDICFRTPSDKYIHWRPVGITTSADYVQFQLTEGETYSSGTPVVPINRNRNSGQSSRMIGFVKNATCTPAGTLLASGGVGTSGNPSAKTGGGAAADLEIVLKKDTVYALTFTPAGATTVIAELFWYEEERGV